MKYEIKLNKIPKGKSLDELEKQLKERRSIVQETIQESVKNYESLILWGLEQFGITPDGYPENLKRVTIYDENKWGLGNRHVYIDDNYVFSVICEPKVIDPKRYGVELYWRLKVLDELIGANEWRPR